MSKNNNPVRDLLQGVETANDVRRCISSHYRHLDLDDFKECYVLGAGQDSLKFIENCKQLKIKVSGVFDDDSAKVGQEFAGYSIQSASSCKSLMDDTIPLVITTHRVATVVNKLSKVGIKSFVPAWALQVLNPDRFPPQMYYRNWAEDLAQNREKYVELWDLFKDDASRKVYEGIIRFKLYFDCEVLLANVDESGEYFPEGVIRLTEDEVFVDGGAWTGDTVRAFKKKVNNRFKKIYAFEPSSVPLPELIIENEQDGRVVIVNKGMNSETTVFKFEDLGSTASRFSSVGTIELPVTTIDEVVGGDPVSFIKMNIEGAEVSALLGAKYTIQNNTPKLAICVYHNPRDIWEIPQIIRAISNSYEFYLRHHDGGIIQLILYATPI